MPTLESLMLKSFNGYVHIRKQWMAILKGLVKDSRSSRRSIRSSFELYATSSIFLVERHLITSLFQTFTDNLNDLGVSIIQKDCGDLNPLCRLNVHCFR